TFAPARIMRVALPRMFPSTAMSESSRIRSRGMPDDTRCAISPADAPHMNLRPRAQVSHRAAGRRRPAPGSLTARWSVYVVRCRDGALYTGIATDVRRRIAEHARAGGKGAKSL